MKAICHIKKLYGQIPGFKCKPGCTDCCGVVPWAKSEWALIKDKRKHTSIKCPYSGPKGCDIYPFRPLMCRLFGAVNDPALRCPHNCGPKVKLTKKKVQRIIRKYLKLIDKD